MRNRAYQALKILFLCFSIALLSACTAHYSGYTSGFGNLSQPLPPQRSTENLWTVLGDSFDLPDETTSNPSVREQIDWFVKHPGYLRVVAEKARPYLYYIYQQVKKRDLPAEVTLMPMVESAYNPFAINMSSGASGLWQMMTGTALGFGLHVNWWYDGRRDIVASTNAALDYIAYLGSFFNGNWVLAIAAYDTGEGNVQHAIDYNAKRGKSTSFWALPLPQETQNYVPKVLALAAIIKDPWRYPTIHLPFVANEPYLAQVNVGSQIDLSHAAKLAGISLQELSSLNPGYNRWATSPNGPFKLLLPIKDAARFERNLKHIPKADRVTWYRHKVKAGDSLLGIANEYHTSISVIREVNDLHGNLIRVEQELLIPNRQSKVTDFVISREKHYFKALHNIPEPDVVHYTVRHGDSLASIAKRFSVKPRDIIFWNGLKSKTIDVGTQLVIWPPKPKPLYVYYTSWPYRVKAGDNLISIAKQYHVSTDMLKHQNHLRSNFLRVGQILRIPVRHFTTHRNRVSTRSYSVIRRPFHPTHAMKTVDGYYTVQSGDDLYHIARHFHLTAKDLRTVNHLPDNTIQVGEKLKIAKPPLHPIRHYTVKKGDTLYVISRRFKVTSKQIMVWNKIKSARDLHIGQRLVIH